MLVFVYTKRTRPTHLVLVKSTCCNENAIWGGGCRGGECLNDWVGKVLLLSGFV